MSDFVVTIPREQASKFFAAVAELENMNERWLPDTEIEDSINEVSSFAALVNGADRRATVVPSRVALVEQCTYIQVRFLYAASATNKESYEDLPGRHP